MSSECSERGRWRCSETSPPSQGPRITAPCCRHAAVWPGHSIALPPRCSLSPPLDGCGGVRYLSNADSMSMAQRQPRVLDLTGSRTGPQVVVRASTAAEMLVSLLARGMREASATFDQRPPDLADDESGLPKSWSKSFESL